MSCNNQVENARKCNCSYECARRGNCCECVSYHRNLGQLPACYFTADFEKTHDRSIANYLRMIGR